MAIGLSERSADFQSADHGSRSDFQVLGIQLVEGLGSQSQNCILLRVENYLRHESFRAQPICKFAPARASSPELVMERLVSAATLDS